MVGEDATRHNGRAVQGRDAGQQTTPSGSCDMTAAQYERILGAMRKMAPGTFGGQSKIATPAAIGRRGIVTSRPCVSALPDGTPEIVYDWGPAPGSAQYFQPSQVLDHAGGLIVVGSIQATAPAPTLLISGGVASAWSTEYADPAAGYPGDGSIIASNGQRLKRILGNTITSPWGDAVSSSSTDQVAVAPNGIIWVSTDQRSIYTFSSSGTLLRTYNDAAPSSILPDGPRAFAFAGGLVYLAAYDGIWVADPTAEYDADPPFGDWRLPFTNLYSNLNDHRGIAVRNGVAYVSVRNDGTILSVPVGGGTTQTAYTANAPDDTLDFSPYGLTVIDGYLYAASLYDYRIYRWRVC